MSAREFVISRLIQVINLEKNKSNKSLLVFKGFPAYFYSELDNHIESIGGKKFRNNAGYIDVGLLDNAKNDLLIKFLTGFGVKWAFYEEFIVLAEMINEIQDRYDGQIKIFYNNIFDRYFPLDIDPNYLDMNYEVSENESLNEEHLINTYSRFYSSYIKLNENNYGVSFINKHSDENIKQIPFFDFTETYIYDIGNDFDVSIVAKDTELFTLKKRILEDDFHGSIRIIIDSDKEKQYISSFTWLLNQLGIKWSIKANERFGHLKEDEEAKYINILKHYWKSTSFRKLKFYKNPDISNETIEISQGNIISDITNQCETALQGSDSFNDIFITAPTGAGKSLLFQIPAIHIMEKYNAVTIVITPLIALMRDQVEQLTSEREVLGVTFINSEITPDEKDNRISKIKNGQLSIVYMSPELFLANSIESLIGNRRIGLLVVDEAHLVTTWGRDFRADYWFLGGFIEKIRKTVKFPILCLTATAVYMGTEDMVNETIESMNLLRPKIYLGNVRRNNIVFEINNIERKAITGGFEDFKVEMTKKAIEGFVKNNIKALCYCPYTSQVEDVFQNLNDETKKTVGKYYGSYNKYDKIDAQEKFKYGDFSVMICTKAFGMGIDISDIDAVYHFAPTGNLADYVQEIGRTARNPEIIGIAKSDYTSSDLKYVRMLYGLSGMKQYQLKEMIRKLYILFREKKNRNMLISPEVFSYLFNENELENKVKSGLLLISKDLEQKYAFNVINVRPKSMFTKNFVCVPKEIEDEFISKYGVFAKPIYNDKPRILPSNKPGCSDIILTNSGQIHEVNMANLWEEHFSNYTFAQFKRKFFNGDLFNFQSDLNLSARLRLTITFENQFDLVQDKLTNYIEKLIKIFSLLKSRGEVFTKSYFKEIFINIFGNEIRNKELPNIILDIFVADVSNNIGFNQNAERFKFIQERKSHNKDELVYRIMNSSFVNLNRFLSRLFNQCKPNNGENIFSTYILITTNGKKPELIYLAILLELFGLASYEVIGGKSTEIFVRINDPSKLRKLSNSNYSNSILTDVERKRKRSQEVLSRFMQKRFTNERRWDIIENYFLGKEEAVDELLNSNEYGN